MLLFSIQLIIAGIIAFYSAFGMFGWIPGTDTLQEKNFYTFIFTTGVLLILIVFFILMYIYEKFFTPEKKIIKRKLEKYDYPIVGFLFGGLILLILSVGLYGYTRTLLTPEEYNQLPSFSIIAIIGIISLVVGMYLLFHYYAEEVK